MSQAHFVCLLVFAKHTTSSVPLGPLGAEDNELLNTGQCSVRCFAHLVPSPLETRCRVDKNSQCLLALEGKG